MKFFKKFFLNALLSALRLSLAEELHEFEAERLPKLKIRADDEMEGGGMLVQMLYDELALRLWHYLDKVGNKL
jgi:hypothetical protein